MTSTYQAILATLMRSSVYPHAAVCVRHLHTHISDVFLAGHYAYKLKKPVDLGFLDFSSLEKRRQACEDEVRLNRRLAPDIYLDVVPICLGAGGYQLGDCASREPVEYAVRMRRLPQRGLLDRLADAGRLGTAQLREAAATIAAFHARADRGPAIDVYGTLPNITARIDQNFLQTRPYIGTVFDADAYSRLAAHCARFLRDHDELFANRVANGHIVDGHGDLHLRNMCLYRGKVVIFDCIEFSRAYRAGDVINDVAFLAMDLQARGLASLAMDFINEYLEHTQDYAGLRLLDFYQAYRAHVRAKVSALTFAGEHEPSAAARARADARNYLDLALRCFAPHHGGLVITSGVSGSGKSTIARRVADRLGAIVVRSDAVRKHLTGVGRASAASGYGSGIYGTEISDRTYAALLDRAADIAASGRWAILDATYSTRARRAAASHFAYAGNLPFAILSCSAPRPELERRLEQRARVGDLSDAGIGVLRRQLETFEAPGQDEGMVLGARNSDDVEAIVQRLSAIGDVRRHATADALGRVE